MPETPSSRSHCPRICPFRDVEPIASENDRMVEEVGVVTQLRELEGEKDVTGILPRSREQLEARRINAIRGCAAAIFHHECEWFINEYDMTTQSYQIVYVPMGNR